MKVVCQSCNATYAINDAAIPAKGARAQCPRCKHLQHVKKPEDAAAAAAPTPSLPAPPKPADDPFASLGFGSPTATLGAPPPARTGLTGPMAAVRTGVSGVQPTARPSGISGGQSAARPSGISGGQAAAKPAAAPVDDDPFASLGLGAPPPAKSGISGAQLKVNPSGLGSNGGLGGNLGLGNGGLGGLGLPPSNGASALPPRPAPSALSNDPFADLGFGSSPPAPAPKPAPSAAQQRPNSDPFAHLDLGAPPPPKTGLSGALPSIPNLRAAAPAPAPTPTPAAPPPMGLNDDPFANLDVGSGPGLSAPPSGAHAHELEPAAGAPEAIGKCRICGKLIYDPFDGALGTCESCRTKEQDAKLGGDVPVPQQPAPAPVPQPTPQPTAPSSDDLVLNTEPKAPTGPAGSAPKPKPIIPQTPMRPPADRNLTPVFGFLAAVVALGVGVGAVLHYRPAFLFPAPVSTGPAIPGSLVARIEAWKLAFPELAGSAEEHLSAARSAMAVDTVSSYRMAENEFKKAAIQAGKDPVLVGQATAGVVEAYLLGRGELKDKSVEAELPELMGGALTLAPQLDTVQRANAYYLLRQGAEHVEDARRAAKSAFDAAPLDGKAEALLAQGCTFLDSSAQQAYDFIDRALQNDAKLRRAYYLRGLAAERVGRDAKAMADFQKRLSLDPDARKSLVEIAKIHAEVGDIAEAKKALDQVVSKDTLAPEAQLEQAKIAYQLEGKTKEAEAQLQAILSAQPQPKEPIQLAALTHLATLLRERGELGNARSALSKALEIQPGYPPAVFQQVLVGLAAGKATEADAALQVLLKSPPEAVRIDALRGRVAFAGGKANEGVGYFNKAMEKSRLDLRAALLGAALASKNDRSDAAYTLMGKAMEIDPTLDQRHRVLSDYYESFRSEVVLTQGGFEGETEDKNLGLPVAYSGVMRYFRGDLKGAEQRFAQALKIEPGTLPALAYTAQMALDKKAYPKAQEAAAKAVDAERLSPLAHFLLAEAQEAQGQTEDARRAYADLLNTSPGFTGAQLRLAKLLAADGKAAAAQEMLVKVYFADPEDTEARAQLFKLGY